MHQYFIAYFLGGRKPARLIRLMAKFTTKRHTFKEHMCAKVTITRHQDTMGKD